MTSPYLTCPFVYGLTADNCKYSELCYDKECLLDAVSEISVLETEPIYSEDEDK